MHTLLRNQPTPGPRENGEQPPSSWHAPVLRVYEMADAAGDPTISDDGLGDGLFS
jgi:hypothetical protein